MTKKEALHIVDELEQHYKKNSWPGKSDESIRFFQSRLNDLTSGVRFSIETNRTLGAAKTFYSSRKWKKEGSEQSGTNLFLAIGHLRIQVGDIPDDYFDRPS